jgi:hypothetical protein
MFVRPRPRSSGDAGAAISNAHAALFLISWPNPNDRPTVPVAPSAPITQRDA